MGGILGGAPKQNPNQTVTNEPPSYAIPNLQDIAGKAQQAYAQFIKKGYNQPYAGQRSAGATPLDTKGLNTAVGGADQFLQAGVPQQTYDLGQFFNNKVNSGSYLAPANAAFDSGTNFAASDAATAAARPIMNDFLEKAAPRLTSAAIDAGAYGGSKSQQLNNQALRDTNKSIGDIASQINYQDFMQKRALDQTDLAQRRQLAPILQSNEMQAAGMVPSLSNQALAQNTSAADIYSNAGATQRGFQQQDLNDLIAKYGEQQTSPFAGLGEYAGLTSGVSGNYGSQTKSGYVQPGTNFLGGLGTLASGLGAGAGLLNTGAAAATGLPWLASGGAAGVGSSLGALFSLLSDVRYKKDIRKVGEKNGFNLYSFSYLWSPIRYIGVLAQEVLEKVPGAVTRVQNFLTVDYDLLGIKMVEA